MSPAEKAELVRRELIKDAREADFEDNFVKEIIMIARAMNGWTIEHVLKMPILRYVAVRRFLMDENEEMKRE